MGFVRGDIFNRDDALLALNFDHAIDEQEGIAVRQYRLDLGYVQRLLFHRRLLGFDRSDAALIFFAHLKRSEEHTSELQSPYDLVCRLLLEKKKSCHSTGN